MIQQANICLGKNPKLLLIKTETVVALSVSFYRIGTRHHNREHSSTPWATGHAPMLWKDVKLVKKNNMQNYRRLKHWNLPQGHVFKCCNTSNSLANLNAKLANAISIPHSLSCSTSFSTRIRCYQPRSAAAGFRSAIFQFHSVLTSPASCITCSFSKEQIFILLTNSIQLILVIPFFLRTHSVIKAISMDSRAYLKPE